MQFDEKTYNLLEKMCEKKSKLIIRGKTGTNVFFETTGIIATDTEKNTNSIVQYYNPYTQSQESKMVIKCASNTFDLSASAVFQTGVDDAYFLAAGFTGFYIYEITDMQGNPIFKNDLKSIMFLDTMTKNNKKRTRELFKKSGKTIILEDPVTATVRDYIGKPIIINEHCGILSSVNCVCEQGNVEIVLIKDPRHYMFEHIKIDSILKDIDGQIIARNNDDDINRTIFGKRIDQIRKVQKEKEN